MPASKTEMSKEESVRKFADQLTKMDDEFKGLKDILSHLNEEYRKANISEPTYKELKTRYEDRLGSIEKDLEMLERIAPPDESPGEEPEEPEIVEEPIAEIIKEPEVEPEAKPPEAPPAEPPKEESEKKEAAPEAQPPKKEKKKLGFLKSLMKKKDKEEEKVQAQIEAETETKAKEEAERLIAEEKPEEPEAKPPEAPPAKPPKEESEKKEAEPEAPPAEPPKEESEKKEAEPEAPTEPPKEEPKPESGTEPLQQVAEGEEGLSEDEKLVQAAAAYVTPEGQPTGLAGGEVEEGELDKGEKPAESNVEMELEKLKVMIETMRETKKATDETIQTLFESTGEIRSMIFQADASQKEALAKLEKLEDDVTDLRPQKITKKFGEVNSSLEKHQIQLEKIDRKAEDMAKNINKSLEMMKGIGGIENLTKLNQEIQQKIDEINEVYKYIERLAAKTEKAYVDLNKHLNEFILYKTKQESLDETTKDILKNIDALGVRFESYSSKRDLEQLKKDIDVIQNQVNELNKALPLVETKLPEGINTLKKQKEDINIFLASLREQMREGKITLSEYEEIKKKNLEKLNKIDEQLEVEWASFFSAIRTKGTESAAPMPIAATEEEKMQAQIEAETEAKAKEEAERLMTEAPKKKKRKKVVEKKAPEKKDIKEELEKGLDSLVSKIAQEPKAEPPKEAEPSKEAAPPKEEAPKEKKKTRKRRAKKKESIIKLVSGPERSLDEIED